MDFRKQKQKQIRSSYKCHNACKRMSMNNKNVI